MTYLPVHLDYNDVHKNIYIIFIIYACNVVFVYKYIVGSYLRYKVPK